MGHILCRHARVTRIMPGLPAPSQPNLLRGRTLPAFGIVVLIFVGLTALFYAPILLGLRTFPDGDFTHHFLPFSLFQQGELLAGRLPVWNPYTYGGHPFLADVQAAVFYPLSNLVLGLTLPWRDPGARLYFLQVEAIVQVALAGFFTYLLLPRVDRQPLGWRDGRHALCVLWLSHRLPACATGCAAHRDLAAADPVADAARGQ